MEKISKKAIVSDVAEVAGCTKKLAKNIIDTFIENIKGHVHFGRSISITGLGKFYPANRAARRCRNPQTGETVVVAAKRVLAFKGGKI